MRIAYHGTVYGLKGKKKIIQNKRKTLSHTNTHAQTNTHTVSDLDVVSSAQKNDNQNHSPRETFCILLLYYTLFFHFFPVIFCFCFYFSFLFVISLLEPQNESIGENTFVCECGSRLEAININIINNTHRHTHTRDCEF